MNGSKVRPEQDVRPHPAARAGPPVSAAGRWWIAVTVLGVPLLMVALLLLPGYAFASRLPERTSDVSLRVVAILAATAVPVFAGLLLGQFRRAADAPAAWWGWGVPAVYAVGGLLVGGFLSRLVVSIDQAELGFPAWWGFTGYGGAVLAAVLGGLLARRILVHLPRTAAPRTRTAWAETIPVGWLLMAFPLLVGALMVALMTWLDGNLWFGLAAGAWVVVVNTWWNSNRVAVTPGGVRITRGAFGLLTGTHILAIDNITGADVVEMTTRDVFWSAAIERKHYAFRPGPALRVHLRSGAPVPIGMPTTAHAHQAAELLNTWRQERPAV